MKNTININGINIYAYHGCLDEEAAIGGNYTVDISLITDFSKSFGSDILLDTIDYSLVYDIVKQEMAVRSKLIEHVANRIAQRLTSEITLPLLGYKILVTKHNPPMNGQIKDVQVEICG